jgi:hypothetical protein
MAADTITYDTAAADNIAAELLSTATALNGTIEQLLQDLGPLKQIWLQDGTSQAGQAALAAETRLLGASHDIIRLITSFGKTVNSNTELARATDHGLATNLFS